MKIDNDGLIEHLVLRLYVFDEFNEMERDAVKKAVLFLMQHQAKELVVKAVNDTFDSCGTLPIGKMATPIDGEDYWKFINEPK